MKALIYFPGDPSVGIFSASFEMELPFGYNDFDPDYREPLRKSIGDLYAEMSGGENLQVSFSDEPQD